MSAIEWLAGPDGSPGKTWNPVTSCTKVSEGCRHCYAETYANRSFGSQYPGIHVPPEDGREPGVGGHRERPRVFTDVWTHPERLEIPLHWRKPRRVFVNSMSDLFHEDVPDDFIDRIFAVMAMSAHHTFLVLTKRPDRMRGYLTQREGQSARHRVAFFLEKEAFGHEKQGPVAYDEEGVRLATSSTHAVAESLRKGWGWPLKNVHLGTSIENQPTADERIPILLDTLAAVRWVSYEPALGPVDFQRIEEYPATDRVRAMYRDVLSEQLGSLYVPSLDWVVVGGESGPKARPCDVAWIRSTVDQCKAAGVPVFVKQLGSRPITLHPSHPGEENYAQDFPLSLKHGKGGDPSEWPNDLRVRELP